MNPYDFNRTAHPLFQWDGFLICPLPKPNRLRLFHVYGSRRPAIFAKSLTMLKAFSTEVKSAQNRFVSSANCESLSSFPNKLIPLTVGSLRILIDHISAQGMNRYGDKEHPCLTPFDG